MIRPLSDDEKKAALRDGAVGALKEAKRREAELLELRKVAGTVFAAYLPKFSPELGVVEAPMPSEMKAPSFDELWSVKPTVRVSK